MVEQRRGRSAAAPDLVRLRLWAGLVLFLFAATHLANHALGLFSLAAMEAGRDVFVGFWRTPPAELALLLCVLVHAGLAIWQLWQRRSLRMPPVEALQLVLGMLIPFWLIGHVLGTGVLRRLADVRDSYAYVLDSVWPAGLWSLTTLLTLVWLHGCIGLHR
jgi:adenylate cyclase